jgi:hypothetical protein
MALFPAAAALASLVAWPSVGRTQENLLHGPHPFLKNNDLSLHVLVAEGMGATLSGAKLAMSYGYKLTGGVVAPVWLDLQINYEHSGCNADTTTNGICGTNTGDMVETFVGARWTFATPLPLVPFLKTGAGLLFAFPNGASDAVGLGVRAVGGANYFFFDWLGLGAQVGVSLGRIDYDATFKGSHNYATMDFGGGVEFQF